MAVPPIGNTVGVGPAQDPAYLAFLRSSGASEQTLRMHVAQKQAELEQERTLKKGGFANELRQARGGVQDEFQDRGMFRSGSRMLTDANAVRDNAQRQQEYEFGVQTNINQLNRDLAEELARMHQERAEKGLQARDNVALSNLGSGYGG